MSALALAVAAAAALPTSPPAIALDGAVPLSAAARSSEPAVRLDPPTRTVSVVASEPPVAIANRSTCRNDLGTEAMTISIAQISYACPVYSGGQRMLDDGAVTMLDQAQMTSRLAHRPGARGTLWIAGHQSSHGAAFAHVPRLADGAVVVISDGVMTASYRIVGRAYVTIENDQVVGPDGVATGSATVAAILRSDRGGDREPRLVLQTCDGQDHRWMIYADLIGAPTD